MAFYLTFKPVSRAPFEEEMKTWTLTVHLFLTAYIKQKSMEDFILWILYHKENVVIKITFFEENFINTEEKCLCQNTAVNIIRIIL